MIFNKITPKRLRKVGRKTTFFMLQCVKNNCKGGNCMRATRRIYLDNIRWITVCIVVVYHVIYMFNGVQTFGVIGPFRERQWQDAFQYLVYPWFMALLFVVSGMAARYYLERHDTKAFIRDKTRKLHFPVFDGCNHMQYQIRDPKGFAGMLEKMLKENKLPELPFVI